MLLNSEEISDPMIRSLHSTENNRQLIRTTLFFVLPLKNKSIIIIVTLTQPCTHSHYKSWPAAAGSGSDVFSVSVLLPAAHSHRPPLESCWDSDQKKSM